MTPRRPPGALERLAAARGVAVAYTDAFGRRHPISPDTLVAVLAALGEPIERPGDARECLARLQAAAGGPPPVVVAWDGRLDSTTLRSLWDQCLQLRLELEDGSDASELLAASAGEPATAAAIPFGVHRLHCRASSVLVISSPRRARQAEPGCWGVFAPTYALVDEREGDTGDLTCLQRLGSLVGGLGASYVSTLPLLADYSTHDSQDAVVSPYSPVSRLWWNEAYLDVARIPASLLSGAGVSARSDVAPGRTGAPANVARAGARVRATLAGLRLPPDGIRSESFDRYVEEHPGVMRYAAYRAAVEARGIDRRSWPERWRAGDIVPGTDVDRAVVHLHVLAQWLTDLQIADVAAATSAGGCRLMLDLPVGCRPDGYDTWAFPASFAGRTPEVDPPHGASVGAPPDRFFANGQDWGFRPLDPEGERMAGYPVVRGALSHLLAHAGALRIDHVLGLQRLWWIPPGAAAADGTYVSYASEELVALACLEAWRRDAVLIGEDLGTVDPAVRRLMADHGIAGMRVAIFDLEAAHGEQLHPPAGACTLVDTHDTATFAGWLDGTDIDKRFELGFLDTAAAAAARASRSAATGPLAERLAGGMHDAVAMYAAVLEELGESVAGVVIATLEDLWAEREPQNIPGTHLGAANFTRRMTRSLATIEHDDELLLALRRLDSSRARRRAGERACTAPDEGRVAS